MSLDIPSWVQAGVVVVSLSVGGTGAYYSMSERVAKLETQGVEVSETLKDLGATLKGIDATTKRLEIASAVTIEKVERLEERKGR